MSTYSWGTCCCCGGGLPLIDIDSMCITEAVAYVAGEPHSDHPASWVIAKFLIAWHAALPSDAERERLLRDLIPLVVGTTGTWEQEARRVWMVMDWLIREYTPVWLDLVPALADDAARLRTLPEIVAISPDIAATIDGARERAATAWIPAGDAEWTATAAGSAEAAAWTASGAAVRDAVRATAGDAARHAAYTASGDAACDDAAMAAACDAAGTAARGGAASGDAARASLAPTVSRLQDSARDLVLRLVAVTR